MISDNKPLVLASSSPRREQLLRSIGLKARILPSEAEEQFDPALAPESVVLELAGRKAAAVAHKLRENGERGIVIGADTIVVLEGRVLGKPENRRHALEMLSSLQGCQHEVYTGVALVDTETGDSARGCRMTRVRMKPSSHERLERYVDTGEPLDKAGAYAIQGIGATLVESMEGCYFNVVGLPLSLLSDMLDEFGVKIL